MPAIDDINKDCAYDYLTSECVFFEHRDFRESTLKIERNDGAAMSRFNNERDIQIAPVVHGTTRLATLRSASFHLTNPFMEILKDKYNEHTWE